MTRTVKLGTTGRVDGALAVREFEDEAAGKIAADRRRDHEKRKLYAWIHAAHQVHGLTSPTLLGQALHLSSARIIQILEDLGLHKPRRELEQHLEEFPAEMLDELKVLNQTRSAARCRKKE